MFCSFSHEHSGWIVYEIQGLEHLLVVFNAKGQDFQFDNAGNLELLVTNSHLSDKDMVGGVSASVFKVCRIDLQFYFCMLYQNIFKKLKAFYG